MIFTASLSPPQVLMNRVLESDFNYSTVEVTREPLGNDSRVGFFHYQVIVDLEATNYSHTLYNITTANTTVILVVFLYDSNITFSLCAIDHCGGKSSPVVLVMNNIIDKL